MNRVPDGVELEVVIAADHPAFAGHFPGAPVLPGVVLLSLVMEALSAAPVLAGALGPVPCIDQVKFLAPVRPGQLLRIRVEARSDGLSFEIRCAGSTVARGRMSAARLA